MQTNLPDIQKRAVQLIPDLLMAIRNNANQAISVEDHPAVRMIRADFSSPDDRLMGALLRAYIEPLLKHGIPPDADTVAHLQDIFAGNVDTIAMHKRTDEEKERLPKFMMLPKGTLGMHVITRDVLVQKYGEDAGTRLAATIAPLSAPKMIPNLFTVGLPKFSTREIADIFKAELSDMKKNAVNPFSDKTIIEIGGGSEITAMPQTDSFGYKNISAGGRYASKIDGSYVSLSNLPAGQYDYVLTNNVVSLIVPRETKADRGAAFANGDLFCACANLARIGGKIVHTTSYDPYASPVLTDASLHDFSGVTAIQPCDINSEGHATENKVWVYSKQNDQVVTDSSFKDWAREHNKNQQWDSIVAAELQHNNLANLGLTR